MYFAVLKPVILLAVLTSLYSCGSYRPVNMKAINNNLEETNIAKKNKNLDPKRIFTIGDTVKITTKDGKFFQFKVTSVTRKSIRGKEQGVDIQNIAVLETKSYRSVAMASAGVAGGTYYAIVISSVLKKVILVLVTL